MKTTLILLIFLISTPLVKAATMAYEIQTAHNDELFVINGEKFEAMTYCMGWEEGESVVFLEGSPLGVCTSAKLYNINRKESCSVWCE